MTSSISIYWKQVLRKIDQEIEHMYTREDFLRDYPERPTEPSLFAWLEELAQKKHQQGKDCSRKNAPLAG